MDTDDNVAFGLLGGLGVVVAGIATQAWEPIVDGLDAYRIGFECSLLDVRSPAVESRHVMTHG